MLLFNQAIHTIVDLLSMEGVSIFLCVIMAQWVGL